ncbi:hypothetical protein M3225_26910 [Priestia aryabhattai]|uniref:hypothetical protein n=1 Tax=Priestia aryabhattai TaxID=412384 RepID=UPI0020426374|nr:hypothetical protein [Priestia aryabhattai]MCM3774051.1 hypothetical protein [Priestia aryabhattai]
MSGIKPNTQKTNPSVHDEIVQTEQNKPVNFPKTKKKKWEDNYTRATVYIQNDRLEELNRRAGTEKGEKTRIVNEALREYFKNN